MRTCPRLGHPMIQFQLRKSHRKDCSSRSQSSSTRCFGSLGPISSQRSSTSGSGSRRSPLRPSPRYVSFAMAFHGSCADFTCQRNNKLVWDESVHIMEGLFDEVWGGKDEIAVGHVVDDVTLPVCSMFGASIHKCLRSINACRLHCSLLVLRALGGASRGPTP